jgi:hypothetical protein
MVPSAAMIDNLPSRQKAVVLAKLACNDRSPEWCTMDRSDRSGRTRGAGFAQVAFDEQRLVSDVGLLLIATLADRLGLEDLVNKSV